MKAKFYTDTHIAKAVAAQARKAGIDIIRCEEVGRAQAKDIEHLEFATAERRMVISADEDFPILHAEWQAAGKRHAGIIYVQPTRKDQIGMIVEYLKFIHDAVETAAATLEEDVYNSIIYL
jgi:predicted nuclease of predicted toxin-antitoxin system